MDAIRRVSPSNVNVGVMTKWIGFLIVASLMGCSMLPSPELPHPEPEPGRVDAPTCHGAPIPEGHDCGCLPMEGDGSTLTVQLVSGQSYPCCGNFGMWWVS